MGVCVWLHAMDAEAYDESKYTVRQRKIVEKVENAGTAPVLAIQLGGSSSAILQQG